MTADHVAPIRAMLTGDIEGYKRMSQQITDPAGSRALGALITVSFFRAGEQRFKGGTAADVTAFVEDLRTRRGLANEVDPQIAERLLLATFTDEEIDDISAEAQGDHFGVLLAGLIADADLSEAQLDAFLEDARKSADEWLADAPPLP
ncbi:hypothetical protein [Actinomadura decatromicini]|uniref:Uncharacterized protein n=1 Tax=Actinomadura decatromicini TaxID=2604572 RepID=A0A5D3FFU1_9ACTN|nr:hypothetical protein [Actinomadura decatromicini]TYK47121.1 hypothetical protein FXF68_25275 [Actinomadura decatromicini]